MTMTKKQEWFDQGEYIAKVYGVEVTDPQSVKDFEESAKQEGCDDFLRRFHDDYNFWKELDESLKQSNE